MGAPPPGITWPPAEEILRAAFQEGLTAPASAYIHVPFCDYRCGYCDFNTYTADFGPGANRATYAETVVAEIQASGRALHQAGTPPNLDTVFFGGGTPTLLSPKAIGEMLRALENTFGLRAGAEITVEANPETLTESSVAELAEIGVTRVSIGMQSAVPEVLHTLDRRHRPGQVPKVLQWAKAAGLETSLDVIYGAPGETAAQWDRTLAEVVALDPGHVSAYSLIVEPGTKMAAQIARGELPTPDEDLQADKYLRTDAVLAEAGYRWYEISNFAKAGPGEEATPAEQLRTASRHNLAYWLDHNWWGYGPGAHSHWGPLRWWNVKHPTAYAGLIGTGKNPGAAGEILDEETRSFERLMLGIRTSAGVAASSVQADPADLVAEGLLDSDSYAVGRLVLTLRGRLLADYVTRTLAAW